MSESYSTTVSFPVRYKNLDKDLVLMNELPNHLSLNIKSRGFNLMSYRYLTNIEPIIIDISDLKERRLGKFSYRYMTTSGIKTSIANQIKGKVEVMDVSPDTLHFEFDRKRKKTVPVRLVRNFEFEPQYQVYGDILIVPNTVEIFGSRSMLDTIAEIRTQLVSLTGLNSNVIDKTKLDMSAYNGRVKSKVKKINLDIKVEKYTEGLAEAEIKVANLPGEYSINTFPSKVNVRYLVALKDYESVQSDYYSVKADFSKKRDKSNKLNLKISQMSSRVTLIDIEPNKVEFIINK
ncbi:MAG: YbbR-like domain-containing protein [Flavobacteriales bacterium]|nr:YbbR-like domain-containing protein [Flavobacteriales bacterium]